MSTPRVSIVLVNWNNFNDSVECLESLQQCTYPNYDVTLVDNGSDGDDARLLKERFGDFIRLIENERNLGFAKGCNIGIRDALDRGADYIMLLNNDTVVTENFLDEIMSVVRNGENVGIAGGKILCYEYPNIIWFAGGEIDYRKGITPIKGSGEVDTGQNNEVVDVDWICSCYMVISSELLRRIGMFDERFFFGWEDADLCVRAVNNGYRVLYVPSSKIWHKGWGGRKKRRLQGLPLYYATRGRFIFIDKHFSRYQRARSWLYFIIRFPTVVWDYARITTQWKAPIYMLWAIADYVKMKCTGRGSI